MPTLADLTKGTTGTLVDPATLVTPPDTTTQSEAPPIKTTLPPVPSASLATPAQAPTVHPATGTLVQLSDKPVNPNDLLRTAIANSADPEQAQAKIDASKALGDYFSMHPGAVHANFDALTDKIWGPKAQGQPPTTILQKAGNMLKAPVLQGQLADLDGQMFMGDTSPDLMERRDALKKEIAGMGPALGWVPQQVVNIAYQLGYQGANAAATVGGAAAAGVQFFSENALNLLSGGLLGKWLHFDYGSYALKFGLNSSSRVIGSLVGGAYGSLIDRGVDPTTARIFAGGLGALQIGLMALPIGKAAMGPAEDALANGLIKPMLNGSVDKAAAAIVPATAGKLGTFLGMDAATAQTAKAITKQGLMAIGMSSANAALPEVAAAISGVPTRPFGEIAAEAAEGAVGQFIVGAGSEMFHEAIRAHVESVVDREMAKQAQEQDIAARVAENMKAAKESEVPEHPIETAAKEEAKTRTIGDVMENEPSVPKVKPTEGERAPVGEAQKGALEGEGLKPEQVEALANGTKTVEQIIDEIIPSDLKEKGLGSESLGGRAIPENMSHVDAVDMAREAADVRINAILEGQHPDTGRPLEEPITRKLTEEQGRALDEATRSEEGTADYIERRPEVQALTKKIQDLQIQVDEGKAESQAALDAAKAEKSAVVASVRKQIETRIQVNKDIKDIRKVVSGAKWMNRDLGDAVNAIADKLELKGKTSKAGMTDETLGEIAKVRDMLIASPDGRAPSIDMNKLSELSKVRARDLSPEDLSDLTDAIKNLAQTQRLRDKILAAEGIVERDALRTDTLPRIRGSRMTDAQMEQLEPDLAMRIKKAETRARSEAGVLANSFGFNGELVFGGKLNDAYRIAVGDMLRADVELEPAQHALKAPVMEDFLGSKGIDPKKNPVGFNQYRGERITEDGFILTRGEIMFDYMAFKDANHKESLLNGTGVEHTLNPDTVQQVPEETFLKFFEHLKPDEKKMLDEVATAQELKAGDARAADFEDRYDFPMKRVENHWSKYVIKGANANFAKDLEELQASRSWIRVSLDEKKSVERTGSTSPVYTRDFFSAFEESMNQTALITTMAKRAEAAARVLWDPVISKRIELKFGKPRLVAMREDLKAMAGQHDTPKGFENAMDSLGNVTSVINLAENVKSAAKQVTLGVRSMIQYGGPEAIFKTLRDLVLHNKATRETSKATSKIYESASRRGGTIDQAQMLRNQLSVGAVPGQGEAPALEAAQRGVSSFRNKAQRAGMFLNRKGTMAAFNIDATIGRRQAEVEFRHAEQGKPFSEDFMAATGLRADSLHEFTPAEKVEAAGKYSDYIIGETHATNLRSQQAGIQKYAFTRFLTKFKSEGIKGFEVVRRVIMQSYRNPTTGNIWKAARVTAFYAAAEGAMFYGMDEAGKAIINAIRGAIGKQPLPEPKPNKKEMLKPVEKSIMRADTGMVLGLGDLVQQGYDAATNPLASGAGAVAQTAQIPTQTFAALLIYLNPNTSEPQKNAAWKKIADNVKDVGLASMGLSVRPLRNIAK